MTNARILGTAPWRCWRRIAVSIAMLVIVTGGTSKHQSTTVLVSAFGFSSKSSSNRGTTTIAKVAGTPLSDPSSSSSSSSSSDTDSTDAPKKKKKGRRARIKKNEKVVFFPTAAHRSEDDSGWDIPIHGWIFEPETRDPARRAFVTSLRKYLKLGRHDETTQILKRRVGPFLVDNERRKELAVQMGCSETSRPCCRIFPLPQSKKNGHFEALLQIQDDELADIIDATEYTSASSSEGGEAHANTLQFQAVVEETDDRVFEGMALLIPSQGISVISDIDDTVKITGVGNKKALLRSTFMEEFKEVPGMAELYQQWAHDLDAKFHFVSSSPWQLWEELECFLSKVGFPKATYHLKPIRLKDRTLMNLWKCPLETKIAVIESILEAFPQRKFLLVGDTGEKDPEVYGEIARRYPNQIEGIYVRNVTEETGEEERYEEAWADVNREICYLFTEPSAVKLPASLSPPAAATEEAVKP